MTIGLRPLARPWICRYTGAVKRTTFALAVLILSLPGCDPKDQSSYPAPGSDSSQEDPSSEPVSGTPRGADAQRAAEMASQAAEGAAAPSDEAAADSGRRLFDGDDAQSDSFSSNSYAAEGAAVPASMGPWARSHLAKVAYTRDRSARPRDLGRTVPGLEAARYPPSQGTAGRAAGVVLAAFDSFQKKMFDTVAPVLGRADWGAARRKGAGTPMTPTRVTVHHTEGHRTSTQADTAQQVRNIQHYHMAGRAAEGKDTWDDIGYHFLIDGSGRIAEGRPTELLGAHVHHGNESNIGVALLGDFNKLRPTGEQTESLTRLVSFLAIKYHQEPSRKGFLEGHMHYNQTSCPGSHLIAMLAALRQKIDAETGQLLARLKPGQFAPIATTDV